MENIIIPELFGNESAVELILKIYKDIPDKKYNEIIKYLQKLKDNLS